MPSARNSGLNSQSLLLMRNLWNALERSSSLIVLALEDGRRELPDLSAMLWIRNVAEISPPESTAGCCPGCAASEGSV
jgi:hypothetical protein